MNIMNKINSFNNTFAIKTTLVVSTMWCFYVFLLFSFLPVLAPTTQNFALYWSNVIQLIFLPLIMVGQALLSKNSEERATNDHNALMTAVDNLKTIMTEDETIETTLAEIQTTLAAIQTKLSN